MRYILLLLYFFTQLFSQNLEIQSDITYFEQKNIDKELNIKEEKFLTYNPKHSNFGFTKSTYWLKINIKNISTNPTSQILHFPYTLLDYIDIYEYKNSELILKREYGDLREYKNDGNIPDPSFIVNLKKDEIKTYFYKIKTQGSMNLELLISTDEEFRKYSFEKSIIFSFYFGAIVIMLIYNFILYLAIKDKSYLYYLLFHVNYLLFALTFNGISFAYIWPNIPSLNSFMVPFLMSIGSSLAVIFTIEFLNIKASSSKLYKNLKILLSINIIMTISVLFLSYHHSSIIASLISLISIIVLLGSSIYSHFKIKNPYAKFFALAWGALLIGIFIIHFRNIGLLSVNILTSYSPLIGAFIELTLLSLALAYRYKIQQEDLIKKDNILYRQSRHASMGEMIGNIAHQWKQPINRLNLSLEVIDDIMQNKDIDNKIIKQKIINSKKNIQYMSQTIDDFSSFFNPDKKKIKFNIYNTVEKALKLIEGRIDNIQVRRFKDKESELYSSENEFLQILLVIFNNALDNFEIRKIKNPEIEILLEKDKDILKISIIDNGKGIDKENIDKIFDPYFTTKFKKEGTGLGLYMAKMLVEQNIDGRLDIESNKTGSTFIIQLKNEVI